MSLENKFIFLSNMEYYKYGQILEKISDEYYLVDFHTNNDYNRKELVHLHMMTSCDECERYVQIFDAQKDMMAYVEYLETPSEPKDSVIKLVK